MALGGEQIAGRGEVKVEPGRPIRGLLPWFRSEMLVVTVDRVSERHSVDKENLQVLELSNGMVWVLQTRFLRWEEFGLEQVSAIYGPQAKSGPLPVFISKVLLEHHHTRYCL